MAKTTQTKNRPQRKQPATSRQPNSREAQDGVNHLYVAHQVHTLANILLHRMATASQESWSCGTGVQQSQQPTAAFGFGVTPWSAGPWQTAAGGASCNVPQPLLYWYP